MQLKKADTEIRRTDICMRDGVFATQEGYGRFCASFRLNHVVLELAVPSWQFGELNSNIQLKLKGNSYFKEKVRVLTLSTICICQTESFFSV